jgi:hypothetical protein
MAKADPFKHSSEPRVAASLSWALLAGLLLWLALLAALPLQASAAQLQAQEQAQSGLITPAALLRSQESLLATPRESEPQVKGPLEVPLPALLFSGLCAWFGTQLLHTPPVTIFSASSRLAHPAAPRAPPVVLRVPSLN